MPSKRNRTPGEVARSSPGVPATHVSWQSPQPDFCPALVIKAYQILSRFGRVSGDHVRRLEDVRHAGAWGLAWTTDLASKGDLAWTTDLASKADLLCTTVLASKGDLLCTTVLASMTALAVPETSGLETSVPEISVPEISGTAHRQPFAGQQQPNEAASFLQ